MIFTVRDLGFEIGPFLLEGWWALAARAVCAAVIVFAGLLVGWLLRRKIFPALLARSWHFAATPILLRSLQGPLARMAFYSGLYLALTSLPWAIPGLTKFLFTAYKIATTLLFCQGLYNASEVADLLLASFSPEIRSNKTLRSLLDTTYKVLVIILGAAMDAMRIDSWTRMMYLMLILGFLGWPGIARLVRGQILSLREQEFMTAAEACGISAWHRIFRHLIPNVIPQLIVTCTMSLGSTILTEATLSFLGLGVKYPFASWGNIINDVNNAYVMTNYLFIWVPAGICLLITVLGFNFVGDGLRDAFDPKMKR